MLLPLNDWGIYGGDFLFGIVIEVKVKGSVRSSDIVLTMHLFKLHRMAPQTKFSSFLYYSKDNCN